MLNGLARHGQPHDPSVMRSALRFSYPKKQKFWSQLLGRPSLCQKRADPCTLHLKLGPFFPVLTWLSMPSRLEHCSCYAQRDVLMAQYMNAQNHWIEYSHLLKKKKITSPVTISEAELHKSKYSQQLTVVVCHIIYSQFIAIIYNSGL
jgi:hypothetical protein